MFAKQLDDTCSVEPVKQRNGLRKINEISAFIALEKCTEFRR
ncbi:hypothetical protein ACVIHH_000081 [Bradyrhizobium sp. USDA 4518]